MKTQEKVLRIWRRMSPRERRIMRTQSKHGSCAVVRCRCKVIVSVHQHHSACGQVAGQVDFTADRGRRGGGGLR